MSRKVHIRFFLLFVMMFVLGGCTSETVPEPIRVAFNTDGRAFVTVYSDDSLTESTDLLETQAIDGATGQILSDGNGMVIFQLRFEDGYELDRIVVLPELNFREIAVLDETNHIYVVNGISGPIDIDLTTKESFGDYQEGQPIIIEFRDDGIIITNNKAIEVVDGIVRITHSGTYDVFGSISEGSLLVDVGNESDVTLVFGDLSITSTLNAPIQIQSANKVILEIKEGKTVTLSDLRPIAMESDASSALFANTDIELRGQGSLVVNAQYYNGIGSKDDLLINSLNVTVVARNNGIQGSDSLTIEEATIDVTAVGGDGLKTSNSEVSAKGNQRGTIAILGGSIDIHAAADGIDAAFDVIIDGNPNIRITTTPLYTSGVGEPLEFSDCTVFLRVYETLHVPEYRFALYMAATDDLPAIWVNAVEYRSDIIDDILYFFYKLDVPNGYLRFMMFRFETSAPNSLETYSAKTDMIQWNSTSDMISLDYAYSISGSTINPHWYMYQDQTNTEYDFSAKGIKADNAILIRNGTFDIRSFDDGLHANNDILLESGQHGTGQILIETGDISIMTRDTGIKCDGNFANDNAMIQITDSYMGIIANQLTFSGGSTTVVADYRGVVAISGKLFATIWVTGGYLDVLVGTGTTLAIFSYGDYLQTGGFVLSLSAKTSGGGGALQVERFIRITGGTFVAIGGSADHPNSLGLNHYIGGLDIRLLQGYYELIDELGEVVIVFETKVYDENWLWISSDSLKNGTIYTLYRDGVLVTSWTQPD